jgi:hypothetical protein
MSKVNELREKYKSVRPSTFDVFVKGDTTSTKKYLEFFLKKWVEKQQNSYPITSKSLIDTVNKFDDLLPYIENKDIYSSEYNKIETLLVTIINATKLKEEKTFVREEHVNVILETDDYLFVNPKTLRGSLKYGANTKWCTASKNEPHGFKSYSEKGVIAYLIKKNDEKDNNLSKIAFYFDTYFDPMDHLLQVYNILDNRVNLMSLVDGGWDEDDIFEVSTAFRLFCLKMKRKKDNRKYVDSFMQTLKKLDFDRLQLSIKNLDDGGEISYISEVKESVNNFLNTIKIKTNAIRETKD